METQEKLITWSSAREWPATHHKISAWEPSDNVAKSIATTIKAIGEGNKNSVEVLTRIKQAVENGNHA